MNGETVHPGMGVHSQQFPDGSWGHMVTDALGSVREVMDENLNSLEARSYDPYGDVLSQQGTPQTPFGFTGEPTDPNDLIHLRARYLDPALGTFLNPDPLPGNVREAMSLNPYAYANANPVNMTDPTGNSACFPGGSVFPFSPGASTPTTLSFVSSGGGGSTFTGTPDCSCCGDATLRALCQAGLANCNCCNYPGDTPIDQAANVFNMEFANIIPSASFEPSFTINRFKTWAADVHDEFRPAPPNAIGPADIASRMATVPEATDASVSGFCAVGLYEPVIAYVFMDLWSEYFQNLPGLHNRQESRFRIDCNFREFVRRSIENSLTIVFDGLVWEQTASMAGGFASLPPLSAREEWLEEFEVWLLYNALGDRGCNTEWRDFHSQIMEAARTIPQDVQYGSDGRLE